MTVFFLRLTDWFMRVESDPQVGKQLYACNDAGRGPSAHYSPYLHSMRDYDFEPLALIKNDGFFGQKLFVFYAR